MNTNNDQPDSWDIQEETELMIRINLADQVKLLPYAYLMEVTFETGNPNFLKLEYSSCVVEITGDDLEGMLSGIQNHTISCIRIGASIKDIKVSGANGNDLSP